MKKLASVERGQAISFRVPSDIPDHLLKQLQKLRETERRNFSSKIAEFVMQGVNESFTRERETITIPLPRQLSKSQRDWLKHEHSEALLGSIVYHLLTDPVRATALLASLNSKSPDINEALYLQEEVTVDEYRQSSEEATAPIEIDSDDDISHFDWENAKPIQSSPEEEEQDEPENDLDNLLGDFLAKMNK